MKRGLKYYLFLIINSLSCFVSSSQTTVWNDYFNYSSFDLVEASNKKIYASNSNGLMVLDKEDNHLEKLNKINGLNDVLISCLNYIPELNQLYIGYQNGNIDIIENDEIIYNVNTIKNSTLSYSKSINTFYYYQNTVYIATNFGIVSFNPENKEVKETFLFGFNSSFIQVNDLTVMNNTIYAATGKGLYKASVFSNLMDINAWNVETTLYPYNMNWIKKINNKLLLNADLPGWATDSVYELKNGMWYKVNALSNNNNEHVAYENGKILITHRYNFQVYDTLYNSLGVYATFNGANIELGETVFYGSDHYLVATKNLGVLKLDSTGFGDSYVLPGPVSNRAYKLLVDNNALWVAPGSKIGFQNAWYGGELYKYYNNEWKLIKTGLDTARDFINIIADPNSNTIYAASYFRGVFEVQNDAATINYNPANSTIKSNDNWLWYGVEGMAVDTLGNFWCTNTQTLSPLVGKLTSGNWVEYALGNYADKTTYVSDIVVDNNSLFKWVLLPKEAKVIVYDDKLTYNDTADDRLLALTHAPGFGNIPGTNLKALYKDKQGSIWVCTDNGIIRFSNPSGIFSTTIKDGEIPTIENNGLSEPMMFGTEVNCMEQDQQQNYWIGTESHGLYCIDKNLKRVIHHFDFDNSPLISNNIKDLEFLGEELFIATNLGVVALKLEETFYHEDYRNVKVIPNPVKSNYEGWIKISGLANNSHVSIVDISGNLIVSGKSEGNEYFWDGKNKKGEKVATGVYLVLCADNNLKVTETAKILIIK
ncbi:MAG: hypothetical protein Kow0079_09940 [Vicingaceae bacterium]